MTNFASGVVEIKWSDEDKKDIKIEQKVLKENDKVLEHLEKYAINDDLLAAIEMFSRAKSRVIYLFDLDNFNIMQKIEEDAQGICIHENYLYTYTQISESEKDNTTKQILTCYEKTGKGNFFKEKFQNETIVDYPHLFGDESYDMRVFNNKIFIYLIFPELIFYGVNE